MSPVTRDTRLRTVLGELAGRLERGRKLRTVGDLLDFLPRRYIDVHSSGSLAEFSLEEQAVLMATVVTATTRRMQRRKGMMLQVVIQDADGQKADLVFFHAYGHEERLVPGARALFRGKLAKYHGRLQLAHPDYTLLDGQQPHLYQGGLVPIYLAVPKVTDMQLTQAMTLVLDQLDPADDPVPEAIRRAHGLVDTVTAYRMVHLPTSHADVGRGKRRMRYDEALVVQTALAARRAEYDRQEVAARPARGGGLLAAFDARLPFELTRGQREVAAQIAADMARSQPMHRLLQGEVGSGKTVVALRAMLAVIDSGAQAALLAPTEVLAQQHVRSIRAMLGDLAEQGMLGAPPEATRVLLLTGSMTRRQREKALLQIATEPVGIVVGTHALIQENVMFADLGLVVVDEQHRFGVEQRDALRGKALHPPHVLVMTATPIPRTVAMTVFGDMDTSALTELPSGRRPIESHVVPAARPGWLERTWARVAEEVGRGHQVYVVCPRIGEEGDGDDDLVQVDYARTPDEADPGQEQPSSAAGQPPELTGVHQMLQQLQQDPALAGLRIRMLHGKLPSDEKDAVMGAFAAGEVDVLVSTTVIEVGVDVPNATMMVVMDADRFGISQLHQLRGRVGRGSAGGLCLLVTDSQVPDTLERLTAVAATTDGFALADLDLELRREGDVLGAAQSGLRSGLRMLRLTHPKDVELIELARADATDLIAQDPTLAGHPGLAALIAQRLDDDQVAFLERG